MFSDKVYEAEGFESSWKDEKTSCNESVQTTEFSTKDQGTNTARSSNVKTQTDSKSSDDVGAVDMNKLATWLKDVCPDMLNELKDTSLNNALVELEINDDNVIVTANMLQQLDVPLENNQVYKVKKNYYVSSMSWNSTGNTLAVSYSYTHDTWCHHEGLINLYTFNRDDKLPDIPTKKLNCGSCVSVLSFHPIIPSVLCAGTITGEVYFWNNQSDDENNIIATVAGHDDRVSSMSWVLNTDSKKQTPVLITGGLDSYLNFWHVDVEEELLEIKQKYTTGKRNKSISSPEVFSKKSEGGIVHFDFSPFIFGLFILGMENGTIIKCSTLGAKPLVNEGIGGSILDPSISYYEKHEGEINCLSFSPHRKDLFLTCGTDNEIRIFHIEQATPVQIIFMEVNLNSVCWVIHEEKLLVGCGDDGCIKLFSLLNGQLIPNSSSQIKEHFYKMTINKKRLNLVAFGNAKGQVQLWTIPWNNIALQDSYNVYGKNK